MPSQPSKLLLITLEMSGYSIETSLKVNNKLGLWDWPCCPKMKAWVDRDNLLGAKVTGLEELLDQIDQILSV